MKYLYKYPQSAYPYADLMEKNRRRSREETEYELLDTGAGLGASHQTGWTGVVAKLIELFGLLDPQKALDVGKTAAFASKSGR